MSEATKRTKKSNFRPKQKLEAVEKVMAGSSTQSAADLVGASEDLVTKWLDAYSRAGRNALRYTGDDGELPRLADLERTGQRAFPIRLMHECDSVASFFCAQFYGRNDVIHVYRSGVPNVTLVDLDETKLDHMRELYPDNWEIIVEDAFSAAERFAKEKRKFDAVICDPYSNLAPTVALERLDLFLEITNKYFLFFCTTDILKTIGSDADVDEFATKYADHIGKKVNVKDLIVRSSHAGGVYWCIIEV